MGRADEALFRFPPGDEAASLLIFHLISIRDIQFIQLCPQRVGLKPGKRGGALFS